MFIQQWQTPSTDQYTVIHKRAGCNRNWLRQMVGTPFLWLSIFASSVKRKIIRSMDIKAWTELNDINQRHNRHVPAWPAGRDLWTSVLLAGDGTPRRTWFPPLLISRHGSGGAHRGSDSWRQDPRGGPRLPFRTREYLGSCSEHASTATRWGR